MSLNGNNRTRSAAPSLSSCPYLLVPLWEMWTQTSAHPFQGARPGMAPRRKSLSAAGGSVDPHSQMLISSCLCPSSHLGLPALGPRHPAHPIRRPDHTVAFPPSPWPDAWSPRTRQSCRTAGPVPHASRGPWLLTQGLDRAGLDKTCVSLSIVTLLLFCMPFTMGHSLLVWAVSFTGPSATSLSLTLTVRSVLLTLSQNLKP